MHDYCLQRPEQGIKSPKIRDTSSHELSHGIGDWTCVLWKNSQCSHSLSHLSGLENSDIAEALWQIWKVILNVLDCTGPCADLPDLDSSVGSSLLGSYLVWKGWSRWPLLACECPSQVQQGTEKSLSIWQPCPYVVLSGGWGRIDESCNMGLILKYRYGKVAKCPKHTVHSLLTFLLYEHHVLCQSICSLRIHSRSVKEVVAARSW